MTEKSTSVSLVLGSGGARGLAHIGVIRELESRNYDIRAVAGCSMGALIGGIYALGKLDIYTDWITGLEQSDIFNLLDWTFSGGGFIRGNKLMNKLKDMVGESNIEDLPIDYTAVAVDIEKGKEVWFSDGSLFDAIRGSIAIPAIFTPHHYRERILVDGGLLNPVPVEPTLRTLTDITVVVDVNGQAVQPPPLQQDDADEVTDTGLLQRVRGYVSSLGNSAITDESGMALPEILMRSLEIMQSAITRQHLAVLRPDLLISIPKNTCMIHEFHRARPVIELGRRLTRKALEENEQDKSRGKTK
jgi:NTE family protein